MAREDFKTLYKSAFSSGGAIQNEIVPAHLNNIMMLLDAIEQDSEAIIPLRNKLRTLFILYRKGFHKPEQVDEKFRNIGIMIKEWQEKYKTSRPIKLVEAMLDLAEDIFMQWNSSGAGIVFTVHDANRGTKTYNTVIGRVDH